MTSLRAALRAAILSALICATAAPALLLAAAPGARAQGNLLPLPPEQPIKGALYPALSPDGKTLCFGYVGDLWTVPASGGTATRLTIHEAHDGYPHWSPDGRWIAFSSNREGNYDVYVVSAQGGTPKQLTFHSGNDYAMDWSPDGSKVLFYGMRDALEWQLYSVDVKTDAVKTLTNDDWFLRYGTYSPDGKSIAYDRCGSIAQWWRPKYHGSANMDVYTKNLTTGKITRVTSYDGMDLWPMYSPDGRSLYYVSDELTKGVSNIVAKPAAGGRTTLVTHYKTDSVRWPNIAHNAPLIAYIYGGEIWTVRPESAGQPRKLTIYAPSDDKINNITRLTLTNGATEAEISPDSKTLALVVRGELWTIPAQGGGDARRLTDNPANDYDIIWSKDSGDLLFASDRGGNFNIYRIDVKTKAIKQISSDPNDETSPHYSPDGKWISFLRSGKQSGIYVVPADLSAAPHRVADAQGNNLEFGVGVNSYAWSPDSKWIAFSRRDSLETADIWVVPVTPTAGGKETNVTWYPGRNSDPQWTADGKYLLFVSQREGAPEVYKVPLMPEKQEPDANTTKKPASSASGEADAAGGPDDATKKPLEVKIDFDDIENRAKKLTSGGAIAYGVTPDGKAVIYISPSGGAPDYYVVPVAGGPAQRMTNGGEGTGDPRFSNETGRFYALGANGTVKAIQHMGPTWVAQQVPFTARMDFDRRAEIRQAFNEFWRRLNTGFYDPNMHGVDWRAMKARYEPLLEGVGTKEDFAMYLLSPLVGELNASHTEVSPAGPPTSGPQTAELGLTFDEDYAGPGLKVTGYMPKGPDDDLGPKIKPGEYVLQIDGEDVRWTDTMYQTLADKAGKTVELLVNSKPSKDGARTVKLKAINGQQWRDLEYDRQVKVARDEVDKLSGGRLAYIRIKGMDEPSLQQLEREMWGKAREKDALVLDIRDNGGGNTHDQILAQLSRPLYGYEQPRDGTRMTQPVRYWGKPIILLINQNSASDAEIFPMGFRALHLGKIVGMPTPGYVIGTYNQRLQDGTSYRIPMWGWYTPDGKDMENMGVQPDIKVELTEDDIEHHRDRQLQVAVDTLLKELPRQKASAK